MKVYVVAADSGGEWGDFHRWTHRVFGSKELAQEYVDTVKTITDERGAIIYIDDYLDEFDVYI